MPANLFNRDVQFGLEMAWHGLTQIREKLVFEEVFPWELKEVPLYVQTGKLTKVPGFKAFIASDDKELCGRPMAETYQALKNSEFWEVCADALEGTGAVIESAGTLFDRSRRFLTIKLGDDSRTIGGREFKHRISLIDSIDGTTHFYAVNTSVCVVCSNTARMVMGDMTGEFRFKLKHTKNLHVKIENMEKQVEAMLGVRAEFEAALKLAAEEPLALPDARNLFAGWLGEGASELSTRAVNTAERLTQLYRGGAGNKGETLLDGVSAVTDFYSHESSGGEEKEGFALKQWNSSEYGAGSRAKTEFLSSLFVTEKGKVKGLNRSNLDTLQVNGSRLLADYAKRKEAKELAKELAN